MFTLGLLSGLVLGYLLGAYVQYRVLTQKREDGDDRR